MKLTFAFGLLVSAMLSYSASASDVLTMTDKQIDALTQEQIANLSYIDFMARALARDIKQVQAARKVAVSMVQRDLSALKFYGGLPNGEEDAALANAVRRFKDEIGSRSATVLTVKDGMVMQLRVDALELQSKLALPSRSVTRVGDFVFAQGTWVFEADQMAHPLQTTRIECSRPRGTCRATQAEITDVNMLFLSDQAFQISKWTNTEVVAENQAQCVAYTMTINTNLETALMFRRGTGIAGCDAFGIKPQILRLESGFKVAEDFYRKREEAQARSYESRYGEAVRKFRIELQRLTSSK